MSVKKLHITFGFYFTTIILMSVLLSSCSYNGAGNDLLQNPQDPILVEIRTGEKERYIIHPVSGDSLFPADSTSLYPSGITHIFLADRTPLDSLLKEDPILLKSEESADFRPDMLDLKNAKVHPSLVEKQEFLVTKDKNGWKFRMDDNEYRFSLEERPITKTEVSIKYGAPIRLKEAGRVPNGNYDIQFINEDHGLPIGLINDVVLLSDSRLLIGTWNFGLWLTDGEYLIPVYIDQYERSTYIFRMSRDKNGTIWILKYDGLYELSAKGATRYNFDFDNYYNIWLNADGEIVVYGQSKQNPNSIYRILKDGKSYELKGYRNEKEFPLALINYSGEGVAIDFNESSLIVNSNTATRIVMDRKNVHYQKLGISGLGSIIGATINGEMVEIVNDEVVVYKHGIAMEDAASVQILQGPNNSVFITSDNGVYWYESGVFQRIGKEEGLLSEQINSAYYENGSLFLATEGGGVSIIQLSKLKHFNRKNGIEVRGVKAGVGSKDGIWCVDWMRGLIQIEGNEVRNYKVEQPSQAAIYGMDTVNGEVWLAGRHGLGKLNPKQQNQVSLNFVFSDLEPTEVSSDLKNRIWFTLNSKGWGYLDQHYRYILKDIPELYKGFYISKPIADENNTMWISAYGSQGHLVLAIRDTIVQGKHAFAVTEYTGGEGFYDRSGALAIADQSKYWVFQNYFVKHTSNTLNYFPIPFTLNYSFTRSLVTTTSPNGSRVFFRGGDDGLLVAALDNQNQFAVRRFRKQDGLNDNIWLSSFSHLNDNGHVWLGSNSGLTRFSNDVNHLFRKNVSAKVRYVEVNQEFYNPALKEPFNKEDSVLQLAQMQSSLELPFDMNSVAIYFSADAYFDNNDLEYAYRLVGWDKDWAVTKTELKADYRNLAPGKYVFEVKVRDDYGNWSTPNQLTLVVLAPWWMSVWMQFGYAALLVGLIFIIFKYQFNKLNKRNQEKLERQQLKVKALKAELAVIRSQMNPHFIFNSLSSIQTKVLSQDTKAAFSHISIFATLLRQALDFSQKEFITLQQELDFLRNYVKLESLRKGEGFKYRFELDEGVPLNEWKIPSLILQPFAENAILHGLMPSQDERLLLISTKRFGNGIVLSIVDNGIGRNAALERNQHRPNHTSFATRAIADRVAMINQEGNMHISIVIIDLDKGTEVKITILYNEKQRN
jgi:uncharacterized membrane-anchored protein YhcB (DUF1043 family)